MPLRRVFKLILWLEGRRYVVLQQVADELGVCKRTARRYMEALEEAGWKVPKWRVNREW